MKLRNIFLILGLIGLCVVVFINLHELNQFFHIISTLRVYVLILIVIAQLFSYYLNALYYRSILKVFGFRNITLFRLFQGAMAANFVNYVLPSVGLAGAGFFSQVLSPEVSRGKGFLVQIMRYVLSGLSALILLPVGLSIVLLSGVGSKTVNDLAIYASFIILGISLAILAAVHQEKWLRSAINFVINRFKRLFSKLKEESLNKFIDDFFIGYQVMAKRPLDMLVPLCWSIIYIVVEMATIYLTFAAFGRFVNPGIVIMGYLLANIGSAVGGSLFSIGVFELTMVGTFVALGETFALALSVTLVYRALNLLIGLPPGFVFYHQFLPKGKAKKSSKYM